MRKSILPTLTADWKRGEKKKTRREKKKEKKGRNKIEECWSASRAGSFEPGCLWYIYFLCTLSSAHTPRSLCRWMPWSAHSASLSAEPSTFLLLSITVSLPRVGGKALGCTWMHTLGCTKCSSQMPVSISFEDCKTLVFCVTKCQKYVSVNVQ